MNRLKIRTYYIVLAVAIASLYVAPAWAAPSLSQGFTTEAKLPVGSVVSLVKNSTDTVVPSSTETADSVIGVVINDGSSLLELSNGSKLQVQVATSSVIPTLVSDCNGKVNAGDPITASPLRGIGMVATSNAKIIGLAQGEMVGTTKQKVEKNVCANGEITLGQVPILISVSYHYKQPEKTIIPAAIQNVANAVAGKKVSSLPIIIAAAIFFVTVVIVVSIIYAMIRSSIISVGRNPMAQSAVYRDVIQLSALVLAILGVAVIAIYFILTRM